ncbi:redoxin domain-containing protein, partial [Candidatus Saccharibacteria bacterium]|nr:redoxin domain-containing protein [Candidatus Saccharibacteria bacterium]NIV03781.1 redoxin domain-containing protein [Calditrichia bacterium]NIW79214.1 redoxin domain-containing protein [Calditrichia bacterium]
MLKKAIFALIAVTLLALVLSAAFLPSAAKQSDRDNKKAPKFTLENLQGEKVSLTDYEGKVV